MRNITNVILLITTSLLGFSQIPKDSLVAYYPFKSNTIDITGNGYDGKGENVELVADRYGNPNSAYDFNGSSSAIIIEKPHQVQLPFTVSMWAKIDNWGQYSTFLYASDEAEKINKYSGFWIHTSPNKTISIGYGNGEGVFNPLFRYTKTSSDTISSKTWHHIVASFISLTEMEIYVDGKLIEGIYSGNAINVKSFNVQSTFGRNLGDHANSYYNGQIDDIRIYNKILTERDRTFLFYETPCNNVCEKIEHISVTDTLIIKMLVTNINQVKQENTIKVYPNPTKDFITINTGSEYQNMTNYSVKIINTLGQTVYEHTIDNQNLIVDLKTLGNAGLYYIQIIDPQQKIIDTKKVILQ